MKLRNQIVNYFVSPTRKGNPRIFTAPATMASDVAKLIIDKQLKDTKQPPLSSNKLLHVAFDLDSLQIYIVNSSSFTKEEILPLLQMARIKILKDFGDYSRNPVIQGSPYSLIRIRKISCFSFAKKAIDEISKGKKQVDLPVLEVNLNRTPSSLKWLPEEFKEKKYIGGFVGKDKGAEVPFFDEIDIRGVKSQTRKTIYIQPTPFILINSGIESSDNITEKEWVVISGYRDYLYKEVKASEDPEDKKMAEDFNSYADLFSIKRHLYWGWSMEDFCKVFLAYVRNFSELIAGIKRLLYAAKALEKDGYDNPCKHPYFMSFKIDDKFPLDLNSIKYNGKINPALQIPEFKVLDFDEASRFIIIESPAFIPIDIIRRVLRSVNQPLETHYNDATNTIDIKSGEGSFKEYKQERNQIGKIKALSLYDLRKNNIPEKNVDFRVDVRTGTSGGSNKDACYQRKLSEYYYACDSIKKICMQRGVEFKDLIVLVGPIERIFGAGTKGGFMGENQFRLSKIKWPHEIEKGVFVSPPLIAVNSSMAPSYAEQTDTLVHEYAHNLYSITNPTHEPLYNKKENRDLMTKDPLKWWDLYLSDPDERQAHKEQIKHNFLSGLSVDEIIRNKLDKLSGRQDGVGGAITLKNYQTNYPIALKFRELVEEVKREMDLEEQQNEQPEQPK